MILGVEDFLEAIVKAPQSLAKLQEQAKKAGSDALTLEETEAEIAAVRQTKTQRKA